MKAIISIAALAMTFTNVLAQELRGGPTVSTCLTFYRINLFAFSATISHFIYFRLLFLISLAWILYGGGFLQLISSSLLRSCPMSRRPMPVERGVIGIPRPSTSLPFRGERQDQIRCRGPQALPQDQGGCRHPQRPNSSTTLKDSHTVMVMMKTHQSNNHAMTMKFSMVIVCGLGAPTKMW